MLLQTNSYVVPKERRSEHQRLLRRFRQTLARLGCEHFEVYEQVGSNWSSEGTGRYVQIMRFRDRRHQRGVQAAERADPGAQAVIAEFCNLINFPYQQQQGLFAVGFYTSALPVATARARPPVEYASEEDVAEEPALDAEEIVEEETVADEADEAASSEEISEEETAEGAAVEEDAAEEEAAVGEEAEDAEEEVAEESPAEEAEEIDAADAEDEDDSELAASEAGAEEDEAVGEEVWAEDEETGDDSVEGEEVDEVEAADEEALAGETESGEVADEDLLPAGPVAELGEDGSDAEEGVTEIEAVDGDDAEGAVAGSESHAHADGLPAEEGGFDALLSSDALLMEIDTEEEKKPAAANGQEQAAHAPSTRNGDKSPDEKPPARKWRLFR